MAKLYPGQTQTDGRTHALTHTNIPNRHYDAMSLPQADSTKNPLLLFDYRFSIKKLYKHLVCDIKFMKIKIYRVFKNNQSR